MDLPPGFCPSGQQVEPGTDDCEYCPKGTHKNNSISVEVMLGPCEACPENSTTEDDGAVGSELCTLGL